MMQAYKPSKLHAHGIKAKKSLSQNFLIDQNIIKKLCDAAEITKGETILEIGPGAGSITQELLKRGAQVIAIEKDKVLAQRLQGVDGLKILCEDGCKYDFNSLPKKIKVVANLPFQIATALIEKWIQRPDIFASLTLIVQKEVGERMVAKPNSKNYSRYSVFIQALSDPKYLFTIKPTSFFPRPNVYCCCIDLKPKPFPFSCDLDGFFAFTKAAFTKRRKMLRASLKDLYPKIEEREEKTLRPQNLSLEELATLYEKIQPEKETGPKPKN